MKYIRVSDLRDISTENISDDDLMYIIDRDDNLYSKKVTIGLFKELFRGKLPDSSIEVNDGNYITKIDQVNGKLESFDQKELPSNDLLADEGNFITGLVLDKGKLVSITQGSPEILLPDSLVNSDDGKYISGITQLNGKITNIQLGDLPVIPDHSPDKYKLLDFDTRVNSEVHLVDYAVNNILIELKEYHTNRVTLILPDRYDEVYARKFYIRFLFIGDLSDYSKVEIPIVGGKVLVGRLDFLNKNELITVESSHNIFDSVTDNNKTFMFLECKRDQTDRLVPNVVFLVVNYDTSKVIYTF